MEKSPDAFRSISEVAELLETPAHVLRFWESRFPQIRPVKRAGGRRYYRPADVALLTGIKRLLHDDGMTIRGVQKILREQGVKHVSGVAEDMGVDDDAALEAALAALGRDAPQSAPIPPAEVESAQIIALETALKSAKADVSETDLPETVAADGQTSAQTTALDENPTPLDDVPLPTSAPSEPVAASAEEAPEDPPTVEPSQPATAPVDLFAYVARGADPTPPPPAPIEPVVEAPMTLWAEEDDAAPDQQPDVTVFSRVAPETAGHDDVPPTPADATVDAPMAEVPPPPVPKPADIALALQSATSEALMPATTLAARLRALDPARLAPNARSQFGHLRVTAQALRQRLQAPVRPGS
jgi:DNA-binding transcriptional MerR regulator